MTSVQLVLRHDDNADPPVIAPKTLRSTEQATRFPKALTWLRAETLRLGWGVYKPFEAADGSITGRIVKIVQVLSEDPNGERMQVRVDKANALHFKLDNFDGFGLPSIYVSQNGPVVNLEFRIYHENIFDDGAVYSLWKMLHLNEAAPWHDRRRRNIPSSQFSWWQAFLQDEERACTSDARREEIRTILMAFDD